jgi:hypothetical protein
MKKYIVTIASTIYYQAEIEAESMEDIETQFKNGDLDFTTWREYDLESDIHEIVEIDSKTHNATLNLWNT